MHASTNLPAHGPTSMNLPARSHTLRTSPPVVQHTWSNKYEPLRLQQPSSVNTEHTNLPTRILTREQHNMNLLTYIITCSPPTMNLLAHDTVKHFLVQAQHHKHAKRNPKEHTALCTITWRCISVAKRQASAQPSGTSRRQAPNGF